jgi:hypothetical protein
MCWSVWNKDRRVLYKGMRCVRVAIQQKGGRVCSLFESVRAIMSLYDNSPQAGLNLTHTHIYRWIEQHYIQRRNRKKKNHFITWTSWRANLKEAKDVDAMCVGKSDTWATHSRELSYSNNELIAKFFWRENNKFLFPPIKRDIDYKLLVKYLTSNPLIIKKLSLWIKQTRSWFHIHQRWKVAINSASAITKCFSHSVWNKFSHWFPSDCKCCACARNIRSNQLVWGRFENWILAYDVIHTKLHSGQQHGEDVNDNKFVGAAQQSLI